MTEEKTQNSSSSEKGSSATKRRPSKPNSPYIAKPTIGELVDRRLDPSKIGETLTHLLFLYTKIIWFFLIVFPITHFYDRRKRGLINCFNMFKLTHKLSSYSSSIAGINLKCFHGVLNLKLQSVNRTATGFSIKVVSI